MTITTDGVEIGTAASASSDLSDAQQELVGLESAFGGGAGSTINLSDPYSLEVAGSTLSDSGLQGILSNANQDIGTLNANGGNGVTLNPGENVSQGTATDPGAVTGGGSSASTANGIIAYIKSEGAVIGVFLVGLLLLIAGLYLFGTKAGNQNGTSAKLVPVPL